MKKLLKSLIDRGQGAKGPRGQGETQNSKLYFLLATCCLLLTALCSQSYADGVMIPWPPPPPKEPPLMPFSVKYHHVEVSITNQVANVDIDQVFINENNSVIEGMYLFPIPEEASISSFAIYEGSKKLEGQVLDKDRARQIYEDIVRKMRDPGLLEYAGRNLFQARVYPIPAKGEKRLQIKYSQLLKMESEVVRFLYPLNTEKFSARPLNEVALTVKIDSPAPIKNVYSPTHSVAVVKKNNLHATASFEQKNVKPDTDFILYYTVSKKNVGLNLLTYKQSNEDGFFLLMLSPKADIQEQEIVAKNVIFVLDTSGSMAGEKIQQAKEALSFCVRSLNAGDSFNIIDFNSDVSSFDKTLVKSTTANKSSALSYIKKLKAEGGTDINSALLEGLKNKGDAAKPTYMVFLTDGLPTVGEQEPAAILKNVAEKNNNNARLFVFGVGYDVNTQILDKLSEQNKGVSQYIEPNENIEVKVSDFYSKISHPVLANLKLDFSAGKPREMYPRILPDLFKGSQLVLLGKYQEKGPALITLKGEAAGKNVSYTFEGNFPERDPKADFIPRLWASRKIGYLMDEIRLRGEKKELVEEIVQLSKTYGIITPYTSFLAVEDKKYTRDEEERMFKEGFVDSSMAPSGEKPVTASKYGGGLQNTTTMAPPPMDKDDGTMVTALQKVKTIGTKTFFLKTGVWIESGYADETTTEIKFLSGDYFKLLTDHPDVGKFIALGKQVIFKLEGKWYKVTEE